MLLALLLASAHGALNFIPDDYAKALQEGRAQHKPVFIDFWATWCHSCLSMQRFVLSDPGMKPVADAVVWLSIETEAEKNKPVVEKYPLDGWPTFLLVDPANEQVIGRWLGSGSVKDIRGFVEEGARRYRQKGKLAPPEAAQRDGDQARIRGDMKAAAAAYGKSVALSKPADPERPERLTLYITALRKLGTPEAARTCVQLGLKEARTTGDSVVALDFVSGADECTIALPKDDPDAAKMRQLAIERIDDLVHRKEAPLAADDRSDALATLASMYDVGGKHVQAVLTMRERAQILESAAAAAPDATMASTFDPHRTETYIYLGEPRKAEQLLAQRETEMPEDYNPPARLARVFLEEKKLDEAEAAVDRALAKMTRGQRRVGILGLKAKILTAEEKPVDAVVREQLEVLRELPAPQRNPKFEAKLEEQLRKTASK
jgi:thiol-disulfide isomerase/thioredoxin